ncbi:DUF5597 domain-containing protein [Marvinbryantia formatexigens DSM 14469]|nr:DUF5597 domain-containing protein [Marvinbryantia formatexigens]UWO25745.1 DUF5597 domain-containing protein [Marvinbryantia formatexigens DSM 14469]SDF35376.1 Beta-galactosidase GanA [Marvinbryantia formatexigens]
MYPYIRQQNGTKLLMVDDKPFIMLAGEVHNSNSSSVEYMEGVYDQADRLGMNTLLLPVSWELTEPEEGVFDFSLVDGLILQARRRGKKLGLLWFGAWKNAQCYYAPEWVKTDLVRFARAQVEKGKNFIRRKDFYEMPYTTLSYLCDATREADAKAFAALMAHIRSIDETENTVITVQVENETGLMGTARENSDHADELFYGRVPQEFADYMKAHTETMVPDVREAVENGAAGGSWSEVFGACAEELFSAYYVAGYVNAVAAAGKAEYPLPMTANCWLDKGEAPGKYPTGGPVSRVMEVWRYRAPEIDVIAPDIYVPDFLGMCDEYTRRENPLFIPECATHSYAGARQVYAVGHYHAMCYSPFGFEDIGKPFSATQSYLFGVDVTDPALKTPQDVEEYGWYSRALAEMMPLLCSKYGTGDLQAVSSERAAENTMLFGTFGFTAVTDSPMLSGKNGVCMVVKESEDTFYILINKAAIAYFSADADRPNVDVLSFEEGVFENGVWKAGRRLNGDEVVTLIFQEPTLLKIRLFAYL